MAKLIMAKAADGTAYVHLQAEVGEEIPSDIALAYANLQKVNALNEIAERIRGCDNSIFQISRSLGA